MNPRALFLDFDGVIAESVDVKTNAFAALFADEPAHVHEIVNYHLANTGVSRFDKFEHIYQNMLRRPLNTERKAELSTRFSELALKGVLEAPLVGGVLEFLARESDRRLLFVVSATPHEEMNDIVRQRGLAGYFREVCGSPTSKAEWCTILLRRWQLPAAETAFVGDAQADWKAARANAIPFIRRVLPSHNGWPDEQVAHHTIRDFRELAALLANALTIS